MDSNSSSNCQAVSMSAFSVRKMSKKDAKEALSVFASHGLHEGVNSVDTFLEIDPDGFYIAVRDEDGVILGVCAGPFTHPEFAFIGLYGVRKECIGQGIGTKVFTRVMQYIGDRNVGLNAVPDKITLYRDKLGFKVADVHQMVIYIGDMPSLNGGGAGIARDNPSGVKTTQLSDQLFPLVMKYDHEIHGYHRDKLMRMSFNEKGTLTMIAMKDDVIVGYGSVRENSGQEAMLAPLYADNEQVAELLSKELLSAFIKINPLKKVVIYSLTTTEGAEKVAKSLGLEVFEACPRFFTKSLVKADFGKIYGQLSPNFSL